MFTQLGLAEKSQINICHHPPLRGNRPVWGGMVDFLKSMIYVYIKRDGGRVKTKQRSRSRHSIGSINFELGSKTELIVAPFSLRNFKCRHFGKRLRASEGNFQTAPQPHFFCLTPPYWLPPPNTITEESDYEILSCLWQLPRSLLLNLANCK